jgi:hypothetical protein
MLQHRVNRSNEDQKKKSREEASELGEQMLVDLKSEFGNKNQLERERGKG